MMLDADIVAVSPASVWRVLSRAGLLRKWSGKPSKKGTGFEQPPQPHQHWHIDVSYLNVCATFYYLCSILDGYSRFLVHWDLRESMTEADIEIILERAKERYPGVRPRVISDNVLTTECYKEVRAKISCASDFRRDGSLNPSGFHRQQKWHSTIATQGPLNFCGLLCT
jgi:putative transposase